MNKKVFLYPVIGIFLLILLGLFNYKTISFQYFKLKEWWLTRNTIEWSSNTKLSWRNFKYDPNLKRKLYADVLLSNRYNIEDPLFIKTRALFVPDKSYVSDTTDLRILRVAQAKWNLLEIYRRKMVQEFDSLKSTNKKFSIEDMEKLTAKFYEKFDQEWNSYHGSSDIDKTLYELEERIKQEL